ncbi:hypothetical protein GH714_007599 [Hevea brasiliensis]|uniref:Uncharacterized protein n=1 Tax=Hevea brasiliensis TaxID=3981 RepID=A0A6A6MT14_HEVBR|nr:hypothetical protein GH714_007599 [Hevea brasiliensis]
MEVVGLWQLTCLIVLSIISTIAFIAIVFAIIDCLKKATSVIPDYARLATTEKYAKQESLGNQVAITITEQEFPVIPDTQVQFATMERFLSNIAKEKPIRSIKRSKEDGYVALQCVQHSPDARPAMSDVVKSWREA